jgi:acetyl/propionyl-CoA carboxylase alpha subunit
MDSAALAAQIADYDSKRVNSTDALNKALTTYGVPEIRNTVSGLRSTVANTTNALNQVDPSVTGRTSGSLVTEAQRSRIVNNERAPIAQQLQAQGGQLSDQQQALKDALDQATTTANNEVNDWTTGRSALQSQYDTEYKREQDSADAARQSAAAAESKRQFDMQLAASKASAGSKAAKPSAAENKASLSNGIVSQFKKLTGKDGKVFQRELGCCII